MMSSDERTEAESMAEAVGVVVGRERVQHIDVTAVAAATISVVDPQRPAKHFLAQVLQHGRYQSISMAMSFTAASFS